MKESTILKTAFIISVLGIVLLYLFSDQLILPETRLNETDKLEQLDGKTIKIYGKISKVNIKNKTDEDRIDKDGINKTYTILTIEQKNTINVYADEALNITENLDKENIEIIGTIEGTERSMIFADSIRLLNNKT
ncbi:MAG: hypothetical protein ABIG89_05655 [Candidatus Woesearchaeota archaeon]